ncbi:MAG TPA: transglutaminase domain-containing protein [Chitinophagaceae bacterium]
MMKAICWLLFTLIFFSATGQKSGLPYHYYIDVSVKAYDASSPAKLVNKITDTSQDNRQKVASIFRWITENISYNIRAAARNKKNSLIYEETDEDTARILKPLNLRVAETVLKRKMAVCDGYARLFKTMCDHAGIPAAVITGYARTDRDRRAKFGSNHSWNAVYVDSAWYLLDATWASGHTNYRGDEFIAQYDSRYFLTAPGQFILDHYPEDPGWTLLAEPPTLNEFNYSPFRYMGFIKTGIQSYSPSKGIIEAAIGDSIRFEVNASIVYGLLEVVTGDQPEDTIWNDDVPLIVGGRKKTFTYTITSQTGDWLYVICNGYVILRYKLNLRRPGNKTALLSQE